MGTHPIFESDFDCLTAMTIVRFIAQRRLNMTWKRPEPGLTDLKMTIRDTALLDREKLKNRKIGPIERMRILRKTDWAVIRAASKLDKNIKYSNVYAIIFFGTFLIWGIWNSLQHWFINSKTHWEYSKYGFDEFLALTTDLDYARCESGFFALSLETVLTSYMPWRLHEAIKNTKVDEKAARLNLLCTAAVDVNNFFNSNMQEQKQEQEKFHMVSATPFIRIAKRFVYHFQTYPFLTLFIMCDIDRATSGGGCEDSIRVDSRQYLLSLLLRRDSLPENVKRDLANTLSQFPGVTDYFMRPDLTTEQCYKLTQMADDGPGRAPYTALSI